MIPSKQKLRSRLRHCLPDVKVRNTVINQVMEWLDVLSEQAAEDGESAASEVFKKTARHLGDKKI